MTIHPNNKSVDRRVFHNMPNGVTAGTAAAIDSSAFLITSPDEKLESAWDVFVEIEDLARAVQRPFLAGFDQIVGSSEALLRVLDLLRLVAPTNSTVLILGETGTGKELVARAIHDSSSRAAGSFVKLNCASIPSSLLESELFGHEKGSFTGAIAQKLGRFELAHNGTLFLDEIGELQLELQPKLLRALQDQEFERVGGTRTLRTNARLVAATNRDLKSMVRDGQFRADLYYRLQVFPVSVPPLRERRNDIPLLVQYFVRKYATQMNRDIQRIAARALEALVTYDWPGNIRELQNLIERSLILSAGLELHVALPELACQAVTASLPDHLRLFEQAERRRIIEVLRETGGCVSHAATRLGVKRSTLQGRMKKFQIARQYE